MLLEKFRKHFLDEFQKNTPMKLTDGFLKHSMKDCQNERLEEFSKESVEDFLEGIPEGFLKSIHAVTWESNHRRFSELVFGEIAGGIPGQMSKGTSREFFQRILECFMKNSVEEL